MTNLLNYYGNGVSGRFYGKQAELNGQQCLCKIQDNRLFVRFNGKGTLRTSPIEKVQEMGTRFVFITRSGSVYEIEHV